MSAGQSPLPVQQTPSVPVEGQSVFARMLNVFIAPTKAFSDLTDKKTRWWVPWLVVSAVLMGYGYTAGSKVGFDQIAENRLQTMPKVAEMIDRLPADKKAEALQSQEKSAARGAYLQPISFLVIDLIVAGVLLATFTFGLGAKLKYATSLAVVTFSSLPAVFKFLIAIVSLFAGVQPDGFRFDNPIASNLGYLVDPAGSTFLYMFGSMMDVFAIWTLVLAVIGFSCVAKVKRSSAAFVIFGWYFVFALGMSGLVGVAMSMIK